MSKKRIRANAIYFAILVSVIVALILSGFLLLVYSSNQISLKAENYRAEINKVNRSFLIELSEGVGVSKEYWGAFKLEKIWTLNNKQIQKAAFIEEPFFKGFEDYNLYLSNHNMPLVLAGQGTIEGKMALPGRRIKAGSIDGNYLRNPLPPSSLINESKSELPSLNLSYRQYLDKLSKGKLPDSLEVIAYRDKARSFLKKTQLIILTQPMVISESFAGNIIIKSTYPVTISKEAKLEDVMIVAPQIVIQSGFSGSIHLVSRKVRIDSNTNLNYPSSILVFSAEKDASRYERELVRISSGCRFEGRILLLKIGKDSDTRDFISIAESSRVEGVVYNEGYSEVLGTMKGNIYTENFALRHNGSVYLNHLYNGHIKPSENLNLLSNSLKISKWLY